MEEKENYPPLRGVQRLKSWFSLVGGCCSTSVSYVSVLKQPWRSFQRFLKAKEEQPHEERALPYIAMVANCLLWMGYAVLRHNVVLLALQAIGAFFAAFYVKILWDVTHDLERKEEMRREMAYGMYVVVVTFLYLFVLCPPEDRATHMGIVCTVVCICMMASPLLHVVRIVGWLLNLYWSLRHVLRDRSAASMPLGFALFNTLVSILWTLAALRIRDMFILFVNGLGLLLGGVQLTLIALYGSKDLAKDFGYFLNVSKGMAPSRTPSVHLKALEEGTEVAAAGRERGLQRAMAQARGGGDAEGDGGDAGGIDRPRSKSRVI